MTLAAATWVAVDVGFSVDHSALVGLGVWPGTPGTIGVGTVSGGVCDANPDFYWIDVPGAWTARLELSASVGEGQPDKAALEVASRNVKRLSDAGVPIAIPFLVRGQRGLEPALADVAPRTHDVGPDLYPHDRRQPS